MDDKVGLHVLLLHFASLHQVSHARGVPPTSLPQDCVQSTQQGPDVVLHTATNLQSAHKTVCKVRNRARTLSCTPQPTCNQPTRLCAKYATELECCPTQRNQLAISLIPLHAPSYLPIHFAVTLPYVQIDPDSALSFGEDDSFGNWSSDAYH